MNRSFSLYASALLVSAFAVVSTAYGDKLEVNLPGNFERHVTELAPGQLANVTVYLKSDGDLIDGYEVELVDEVSRSSAGKSKSDPDGVVIFRSVKPGRYVALLDVPERMRRVTTVALGDVRIVPEGGKEDQ